MPDITFNFKLSQFTKSEIAHHEAGHAAFVYLSGFRIHKCSISIDELFGFKGAVIVDTNNYIINLKSEHDKLQLYKILIYVWAGPIAQQFYNNPNKIMAYDEIINVRDNLDGCDGDRNFASETASYFEFEKQSSISQKAYEETIFLVEEHWDKIENIALQLEHFGSITHEEVKDKFWKRMNSYA